MNNYFESPMGLAFFCACFFASLPGCGASSAIPIPSDSIAVVEINCKQLLNTRFPSGEALKEFAPILFQLMGQSPELMEKNLSFNPLEDVDRIIIASGGSEKTGVLLVFGKFDIPKFNERLPRMGRQFGIPMETTTLGNTTVLISRLGGDGPSVYFCGINSNMILVTPQKEVAESYLKGTNPGPGKALKDLFRKVDRSQLFWFAATQNGALKFPNVFGVNIPKTFDNAQMGIKIRQGIRISLEINGLSKEECDMLEDEVDINISRLKAYLSIIALGSNNGDWLHKMAQGTKLEGIQIKTGSYKATLLIPEPVFK